MNEQDGTYGELDYFEFAYSAYDLGQNIHRYYWKTNYCGTNWWFPSSLWNIQHSFYMIYTPDELDWNMDNGIQRIDTKYYGADIPL